jgi:hypothetical protein
VEENHKSLQQEEGVVVVQAIFDAVFEEALGFRVSSEHGGGHGTAKEERHSPHRWLLTVKIRQPNHEFTFGVGISFIPYPLVLTPVV